MKKEQLANKIWESVSRMRARIPAVEYKEYWLGFLFYKILSDREERLLKGQDWQDLDSDTCASRVQELLGFWIERQDLFSTWVALGKSLTLAMVREGLARFDRHVSQKLLLGVFASLESLLARNKSLAELAQLIACIAEIRFDTELNYDLLSFVYEYLLTNFARSSGKRAGEFYTPKAVALLVSELLAGREGERCDVALLDPTAGSGSLLLHLGRELGHAVTYYAQDLKDDAATLMRMNFFLHGIPADRVHCNTGDCLAKNWPMQALEPLLMDFVVANPPYSQYWQSKEHASDPRFSAYGLAPQNKADYAFLLHGLSHLKRDGRMAIVLPHGVLYRGGEEGRIRKTLIERHNLETVIGLPENIFFGTGIPTVLLLLRRERTSSDILFIDASNCFSRTGDGNTLGFADHKRIVDAVFERRDLPQFARLVSLEEILANDCNLSIPRYVAADVLKEDWDLLAGVLGGIPASEIETLGSYWERFPMLKVALFHELADDRFELCLEKEAILRHPAILAYYAACRRAMQDFERTCPGGISLSTEPALFVQKLGTCLVDYFKANHLLDPYVVYEVFAKYRSEIEADLERIGEEGLAGLRCVVVSPMGFCEGMLVSVVQKEFCPDLLAQIAELEEGKNQEGLVLARHALVAETERIIATASQTDLEKWLYRKWFAPMVMDLAALAEAFVREFIGKLDAIQNRYRLPLTRVEADIRSASRELAATLDVLCGDERDLKGLQALKAVLLQEERP